MRAVALTLCLTLTTAACFPTNPRARLYAKLGEGGAIAAGIALLAFVNTAADCEKMAVPGVPDSKCRNNASLGGDVGLGLILAGLVGFIATISTTPDDKPTPTIRAIPETPSPTPMAPTPVAVPPAPATPVTPAAPSSPEPAPAPAT